MVRNDHAMIRSVGGTEIKPKRRLSCHCGSVVLELDLPDGIVNPRRCEFSMCRRRGAIVTSVPLAGVRSFRAPVTPDVSVQHADGEALFLWPMRDLHEPPGDVRIRMSTDTTSGVWKA